MSDDDDYTVSVYSLDDDTVVIEEVSGGRTVQIALTVEEALSLGATLMTLKPPAGRCENN